MTYLEKAVQIQPEDGDAHIGLAMAAMEVGDFSACHVAYEKARSLDPSHPLVLSLAVSWQPEKRTPRKREEEPRPKKAVTQNTTTTWRVSFQRGEIGRGQGVVSQKPSQG